MTKKVTKKKKSAFTVDLTKAQDPRDIVLAFAKAKIEAGIAISKREAEAIVDNACKELIKTLFNGNNAVVLKEDGTFESLHAEPVKVEKFNYFKNLWRAILGK